VGLTESDDTPGSEAVCTLMATTVPHQMAAGFVQRLFGIDLSAKAIKSMTQRRGQPVVEPTHQEAHDRRQYQQTWGVRPWLGPVAEAGKVVEVADLDMDAVVGPPDRRYRPSPPTAAVVGARDENIQ